MLCLPVLFVLIILSLLVCGSGLEYCKAIINGKGDLIIVEPVYIIYMYMSNGDSQILRPEMCLVLCSCSPLIPGAAVPCNCICSSLPLPSTPTVSE